MAIDGYWKSRLAYAWLTPSQAVELSAAIAFLMGEEPPVKRDGEKVTYEIDKQMTVEISLSGDLFAVLGDREKFRQQLHTKLDEGFDKALPPPPTKNKMESTDDD